MSGLAGRDAARILQRDAGTPQGTEAEIVAQERQIVAPACARKPKKRKARLTRWATRGLEGTPKTADERKLNAASDKLARLMRLQAS